MSQLPTTLVSAVLLLYKVVLQSFFKMSCNASDEFVFKSSMVSNGVLPALISAVGIRKDRRELSLGSTEAVGEQSFDVWHETAGLNEQMH